MNRRVLLKGEVPIQAAELEALRRRSAELEDYLAAVKSDSVRRLRQEAMRIRRMDRVPTLFEKGWAAGVLAYEKALGDELSAQLRRRAS